MVKYHNDADVMSVEQVVDCLLNPNDPNQQIPKLIYSLARQISYDPNIQEDLVSRGMLYAMERIHEKWSKPSEHGETIVSLGQMVRAITSNKFFLEKEMTIEAQNATAPIQVKDNNNLYEERKRNRSSLADAGQYERQSYNSNVINSDGDGYYGMPDELFDTASGGLTVTGHKLYEAPDYDDQIWLQSSNQRLWRLIRTQLNDQQQELIEFKWNLQLSNQQIADILGEPNANVIKQRWKRLQIKIKTIAEQAAHQSDLEPNNPIRTKKSRVQTSLARAAIRHGFMSEEVEKLLGEMG